MIISFNDIDAGPSLGPVFFAFEGTTMLENFTDQDIDGDLLDTGYLYLDLSDGKRKRIGITAQRGVAPQINRYALQKGEERARTYQTFVELLQCEGITHDDIRASWKYHGVLLGAPSFCEKLVHDSGCPCSLCIPVDFIAWCRRVVASEDEFVILDTETTGFYGEVIELAIIDNKGHELYNNLLKSLCKIEPDAQEAHHITAEMLEHAPTIAQEWQRICDVVHGRTVITYNAKFDSERIAYSLGRYGLNTCEACQWRFECAMEGYAAFWGAPPKRGHTTPKWQSLGDACWQQGVTLDPKSMHRAYADARATWALIAKIAATGENSKRYDGQAKGC
jgi:DNA polymerase-3 subunit epsilon